MESRDKNEQDDMEMKARGKRKSLKKREKENGRLLNSRIKMPMEKNDRIIVLKS